MPPNPPRIIPTERLISLCEESRLNTDRSERGKGLLAFEIGKSDLPEEQKARWLSILEGMYQKCNLLVATEAYLKYNKAKLIANRNKARGEHFASALPAFRPPEVYDHIQRSKPQVEDEAAAHIAYARSISEAPARGRSAEGPKAAMDITFDEDKADAENERLDAVFAKNQQGVREQFAANLAAGRKASKIWLDLALKYNVEVPEELAPQAPQAAPEPPPSGPFASLTLPDDNNYFGLGEDGVFEALPAKLPQKKNWIP